MENLYKIRRLNNYDSWLSSRVSTSLSSQNITEDNNDLAQLRMVNFRKELENFGLKN